MKTADLQGAALDYLVARAEGIPADQLAIHPVQRTDEFMVVWTAPRIKDWMARPQQVKAYSTNWAQGGPLIEKYKLCVGESRGWYAGEIAFDEFYTGHATGEGDTPLQAICRAVVRAAFGDEVEEVAG